ncbi:MAG: glycoside hydrolase family 6 protein, partial [Actinomycetales bacterium]|nr:glycoside hydrolase family 6 protein [Actinomycetales bacterium]
SRGGSVTFGFVGVGEPGVRPASFELAGLACGTEPGPPSSDPSNLSDAEPPTATDLYLDPTTRAASAAAAASGEERALLEKIAQTPQAFWVAGTDATGAAEDVRDYTTRASEDGTTGVLVIYAVPGRDCGQHSSGGVGESAYARWIDAVAGAMMGEPWVILEPDALPMLGDCDGQGDRVGYLQYAAETLTAAGVRVYFDVGHSGWLPAEEAARRISLVGLDHAVGFALNVSNYQTTADSVDYGERVAAALGGARYVIDTSRNGNGSDGQWCNPRGRALGERPRLVADSGSLDAELWIKLPGESDGQCNGGPAAGQWFGEIALELARNAHW